MPKLKRLTGRFRESKIAKNILWLLVDKVLRMGVGLFLTVMIARTLGPEKYGKWNYAIALTALLSIFSTLGLESILVRDLVNSPGQRDKILTTAFWMRTGGSLFAILLSVLLTFIMDPRDTELHIIIAIISSGFLFQAFDVIDVFFQSQVESKFPVIIKNVAFIFCAFLKGVALSMNADLKIFIIIGTFELLLGAIGLLYYYFLRTSSRQWSWHFFDADYFQGRIRECFPLLLSGLVIMIYMRIDQVMIKHIKDERAVGLYSAAVRIAEIWYFIPGIVLNSFFPGLVELKETDPQKYRKGFIRLYRVLFLIAFAIGIGVSFLSPYIISILYHNRFPGSERILVINIWTGVFVFTGMASGNFLLIEGLNKFSFYKTLAGAVTNVGLNFFLIPLYGGVGAATATLISYSIAAYFSNFFFKRTRHVFYDLTRAMFFVNLSAQKNDTKSY